MTHPPADSSTAAAARAAAVPATILVADDEEDVRRLLTELLRSAGHRVLEASDGEQALAQAAAYPGVIALLITDMVMPGMNGPELAQRLERARPAVKTLFISGYSDPALLAEVQRRPGFQYLRKPFAPQALLARVRALLVE